MKNRIPTPRPVLPFKPVPRRKARVDGWTPDRQRAFIAALSETGSVRAAASRVNMASEGAYALRRAPGAESFAAAWDAALDHGVQSLADIALERAREGVAVPVYYKGEQVGEKRWYNDRLLMFLLKHRLPEQHGGHAPAMPPPPGRAYIGPPASVPALPAPDAASSAHALPPRPAGVRLLTGEMGRDNADQELPPQRPAPLGKAHGTRCADCSKRESIEDYEEYCRNHPDEYMRMRIALVDRYAAKVRSERQERLEGRVIAADFTLRQLTHIELILDIGGMMQTVIQQYTGMGAPGWKGPQVNATPFCDKMAELREQAWRDMGDPPRPFVHRPRNVILDDTPGPGPTRQSRQAAMLHARAVIAEAQLTWEAAATEDSWAAWLAAQDAPTDGAAKE